MDQRNFTSKLLLFVSFENSHSRLDKTCLGSLYVKQQVDVAQFSVIKKLDFIALQNNVISYFESFLRKAKLTEGDCEFVCLKGFFLIHSMIFAPFTHFFHSINERKNNYLFLSNTFVQKEFSKHRCFHAPALRAL